MTRITRNIPADCCCDSWKKGIRTIDGQYPDDNRDFNLTAGDGIEITPVTAGVEISVKAPLPGPMIFRGTVGTGGTVASLPDANVDNIGWTYVALSAGTTPDDTPKSYDTGDTLVSNGEEWTVIPSGDDPVAWSQITGTPTTLSGYGITDAYTKGETDTLLADKVGTTGDQEINGHLALFRNVIIPTTTTSTLIRQYRVNALLDANTPFTLGSTTFRRYNGHTRMIFGVIRVNAQDGDFVNLNIDCYDSGRIYLYIENRINGVTTTHTILDSNP